MSASSERVKRPHGGGEFGEAIAHATMTPTKAALLKFGQKTDEVRGRTKRTTRMCR